ncbi:MAG: hypothetical protein QM489_02965 [Candidatus Izemoplasma sp.]
MRKLVVHRRKHFVASAMKVRICINTELKGDIKLNDVNLKVLGELKNGRSLDVEIPEEKVDVYVVYDKFFPQKFHAKYSFDAGENNEVLYTFSRFSPSKGNPFILTPNKVMTSADKLRTKEYEANNRGNNKQRIIYWAIIIIATIVGGVIGFSLVS